MVTFTASGVFTAMVPELSTVTPAATVTFEPSPEISNCVQFIEIVIVPDASVQLAAYPCAELKHKNNIETILFATKPSKDQCLRFAKHLKLHTINKHCITV